MIKLAAVLPALLLATPAMAQTAGFRAGAVAVAPAPLTPAREAWFREAVDHILSGQLSARMSDSPQAPRTR